MTYYHPHMSRDAVRELLDLVDPDRTSTLIHCDADVLHAPGECVFCDQYPKRQIERLWGRIAFTGYPPPDNGYPCPSDKWRGQGEAHKWGGNAPILPPEGESR